MYNKRVEFNNFEDAKNFTKKLFVDNDFIHNYSLNKSRDKEIIIIEYSTYTLDFVNKHFLKKSIDKKDYL